MNLKLKTILGRLRHEKLDCLLVSSPSNISYLCGFRSRDALLIVSNKQATYLTDARYSAEVKRELKGCKIMQVDGLNPKVVVSTCNQMGLSKVGFEEKHITYAFFRGLFRQGKPKLKFFPISSWVEELRLIKNKEEIAKIREAARITKAALRHIQQFILPGKKEIEIAGELERFIRQEGASCASFEIIVASGPNSSYPHHLTSTREIRNNEVVLIDMGVEYSGYKSDLTRVFFLGRIKPLVARVFKIVQEAKARAINKIKPGVPFKEIDSAAREYIQKCGYGRYFSHSTGHGVGLEVHEEPRISQKSEGRLKPGMVFTVEPGIYLAGKFGIRLEDMLLATKQGKEVL